MDNGYKEPPVRKNLSFEKPARFYCPDCREPLPEDAAFCSYCTPNPPETDPEEGLSRGQAWIRIFVLVFLFVAIASYKLDVNLIEQVASFLPVGPSPQSADFPHDQDFEVVIVVNKKTANLRNGPSLDSPVITVISKGTRLKTLERGDEWSKVKAGDQVGWMANSLLTAEVR